MCTKGGRDFLRYKKNGHLPIVLNCLRTPILINIAGPQKIVNFTPKSAATKNFNIF